MATDVDVETAIARPLPTLLGYPQRFLLAFGDLLRNAGHAAPERRVHVQVTAQLDGRQINIYVDDDGPGVPPEHREAIFAAGYTLRPQGSGQGLALLKSVIETDLGGSVRCADSPLGGARFIVSAPLPSGER